MAAAASVVPDAIPDNLLELPHVIERQLPSPSELRHHQLRLITEQNEDVVEQSVPDQVAFDCWLKNVGVTDPF